jgi:hypothetical protein
MFCIFIFLNLCVSAFQKVPNYVNEEGFGDKYLPNSNVVPKTRKAELLTYKWFIKNLGCLDGLTPRIHNETYGKREKKK